MGTSKGGHDPANDSDEGDSDLVSIARAIRASRIARMEAASNRAMQAAVALAPAVDTAATSGEAELDAAARFAGQLTDDGDGGAGLSGPETGNLVEDHLWLVDRLASQAARRFPRYVERNELWSAGVLGLVEAARRYDASYGVPFAAYASARVRGEMLEAVRSADIAPRRLRRNLRELAEVVERLTQELEHVPSLSELADAVQIDVNVIRDRMHAAANLVSTSLDDDSSTSHSDLALSTLHTEPAERLSQQELIGALREAVAELPEPLKSILIRSHWNDERLVDIAADMGISFQRVAQYRVEAVTALAAWFATLYDAVPTPDPGLPGSVRRAAFCSGLAARSTWRARLELGDGVADAPVTR